VATISIDRTLPFLATAHVLQEVNMTEESQPADPASGTRSNVDVAQDDHENGVNEKEQCIGEAIQDPKSTEDHHEYPDAWSLTAIMIALYLAIFLVALVRISGSPSGGRTMLTDFTGPNHHRHRHPAHHRRLSCPQ
jgi:hypothetical protein